MKHRLVEKPHPEKKKHGNHYLKDAKKKRIQQPVANTIGVNYIQAYLHL
jgi:hypothetical protein